MSDLTLTKNNYLEYLHAWNVAAKTFVKALKGLCSVAPEFTRKPRMKIFNDGLFYESHYSYGKFVVRLYFTYFYLDEKELRKYETLVFDLRSFDIKTATQGQLKKACGVAPSWYDPERKLSDETRELVEQYFRIRQELETQK